MNITNHSKHQLNFKSNYKFNVTKENFDNAETAQSAIDYLIMKDYNSCKIFSDFPTFSETTKTGVFKKVHVSSSDKYDELIESILQQKNINFSKQTQAQALDIKNIYNRIVAPKNSRYNALISLDTNKVEELFKKDKGYYVGKNGTGAGIVNRYNNVIEFLKTGKDIEATQIILREQDNKPVFNILDGRHRFAVMRDIGMEKIKFAVSDSTIKLLKKYDLFSK